MNKTQEKNRKSVVEKLRADALGHLCDAHEDLLHAASLGGGDAQWGFSEDVWKIIQKMNKAK